MVRFFLLKKTIMIHGTRTVLIISKVVGGILHVIMIININGYYLGNKSGKASIYWLPWKSYQSMKKTSMMIRRKFTN